jgi:5-methylcytosine-specific restriction protein A
VPELPKRPCAWPGCPELVERGRCARHRRDAQRARADAGQRTGSTRRWRELRVWLLKERGPWCAACLAEGRHELWTEADHVRPLHRGGADVFENLQGLCRRHHRDKTDRERREQIDGEQIGATPAH